MIQRRLLMGGGGSFPTPFGSGTFTIGTISTVTNDTSYNSWPSACLMDNGNPIALYAKSAAHNLDNTGIIVRIVGNATATSWGSEATVASDQPTYGNINPGVGRLASGRVLATWNYFNYPALYTDYVRVKYSDDDGATWSSMYTIDSTFTDWNANGGMPVQRADGTILVSFYGENTGNTFASSRVVFSSNDGATFGTETTIANGQTDSRQYYEPALLVLDNEDILCLIRTTAAAGDTYQFRSTDDGATWVNEGAAFGGCSTANAIQLRSGSLLATVRGNAAFKLEAFTSINRGVTWTSQGIWDNTSYTELEYACPVQLDDDSVLVVYSVQPSAALTNADIKTVVVTENPA